MKLLLHPVATAMSLSTLSCLVLLAPLADPAHLMVYHSAGPVASMYLAVLLDVLVLWLGWGIVLGLAQRRPSLWGAVWTGILAVQPWIVFKNIAILTAWPFPRWASFTLVLVPVSCCGICLLYWRKSSLPLLLRAQRFAATLLGVYAIYSVLLLSQFLWSFWEVRRLDSLHPLHHSMAGARDFSLHPRGRIIVIVLDELSYQQVYGQRISGLHLPAFDRIAKQATIFTHTIPAGVFTERILPSLMTGLPVDAIRSSADGTMISLHNPSLKKWQDLDPRDTIFQDALNAGYHTAVVGWYNPYCRIIPQVLDRCYWNYRALSNAGMYSDESVLANAVAPLQQLLSWGLYSLGFKKQSGKLQQTAALLHIKDYQDLLTEADQTLEDTSATFLLLHMPVPHPGGIFDRIRGVFATQDASYIDNLALADQYLGHVYSILKDRNEWDSSTILIMGDHSWRTKLLWAKSPIWTPEDQTASHGGQFDDRPCYIVKLAYQSKATHIEEPFPALRTRALLQGIISDQLHSSENLANFVEKAR